MVVTYSSGDSRPFGRNLDKIAAVNSDQILNFDNPDRKNWYQNDPWLMMISMMSKAIKKLAGMARKSARKF